MWKAWKERVSTLKRDTYALYLASRDPRVPRLAKILLVVIVAYALSPIDLIPDFVPLLGYLDDMLLLPLGIALAIKLIPRALWEECQARARAQLASDLPRSRIAAIVIAALWLVILGAIGWWTWRWLKVIDS
jgi:uncharacterized membrane protein YkvA (DUF1232 family)